MAALDSIAGDAQADFELDAEPLSRAEKRDQQTQRIMEAAKACFVRSGFQGASMHQVCAEAGMSPGALYRYFPSKESIIEAITEADRRHDAEIFAEMDKNPCVVDGFVNAAIAHIRYMHESGNAPLFAEIRAESMRNEAVELHCHNAMGEVQTTFRRYLEAAIERGDIDPVVELDVMLPMIMAIGEGLALNDLPAQGVPIERIEALLRVTVEAMFRPNHPK